MPLLKERLCSLAASADNLAQRLGLGLGLRVGGRDVFSGPGRDLGVGGMPRRDGGSATD